MENTNNTSEESVHPERGTERAVSEDVAEGEDTPVVTVDPNGGTELGVNEDNVEGEGQSHFGLWSVVKVAFLSKYTVFIAQDKLQSTWVKKQYSSRELYVSNSILNFHNNR